MVEDDAQAPNPNVAPAETVIETRMAAREVERIVRQHFAIPATADAKLKAMSAQIAASMAGHFLATHRLYWSATEGTA